MVEQRCLDADRGDLGCFGAFGQRFRERAVQALQRFRARLEPDLFAAARKQTARRRRREQHARRQRDRRALDRRLRQLPAVTVLCCGTFTSTVIPVGVLAACWSGSVSIDGLNGSSAHPSRGPISARRPAVLRLATHWQSATKGPPRCSPAPAPSRRSAASETPHSNVQRASGSYAASRVPGGTGGRGKPSRVRGHALQRQGRPRR